jgi:hypothetical protein
MPSHEGSLSSSLSGLLRVSCDGMAERPGGKSFQNFLIVWAAVASIAALIFGGALLLFLRVQSRTVLRPISAHDKPSAGPNPVSAQRPSSPVTGATDVEKPRTAFNALPRGTQVFDGVTFQIRDSTNLIGARAAKAGGREFARISNQPVSGRGMFCTRETMGLLRRASSFGGSPCTMRTARANGSTSLTQHISEIIGGGATRVTSI